MLSLWPIFLFSAFITIALFFFILHTRSLFHSFSFTLISFAHSHSKCHLQELWFWSPESLTIFLKCSVLQYFFLSFFLSLFAFYIIRLFLFFYAFIAWNIPDHVSPLLYFPLFFAFMLKTENKFKVTLLHLKSFSTYYIFDSFSLAVQSYPVLLTEHNNSCFYKLCFTLFHLYFLICEKNIALYMSYQSYKF